MPWDKGAWQRRRRQEFQELHGYSDASHYATGGLRAAVLARDGYACVRCGMSDSAHKDTWKRPITIDHIDRDKTNNAMENLQTLCLRCHGRKDQLPHLRTPRAVAFKEEILTRRQQGQFYQDIADDLGFSIRTIWKWVKRWEQEASP